MRRHNQEVEECGWENLVSEQAINVVGADGSEVSRTPVQKIAELASKSWWFPRLRLLIRPRGLWVSLRYPVQVDR